MTISRRDVLLTWFIAVLFAVSLSPASLLARGSTPEATPAPEPPAFLLEPVGQDGSYFTVTMEPGSTQELTVAFGNGGKEPVSALTYLSDAYTLVNGGFGVHAPEEPTSGVTTWIDYPTETLELASGSRLERTFTVTVPEDAEPGQYISALSIQTAEPIAVGDSDMLRQIIKKSVAVFVIVPGPERVELEIGEVRVEQAASSSTLIIDIRNPGNVFLNPEGTVEVTTADGKPVLSAPVAMGPVYAGTGTTLEVYIPTVLEAADYTVSVSLGDEKRGVTIEEPALAVVVAEPLAAATPVAEPVTVAEATIDPITSDDTLQAVNVQVVLENPASAIPSARLTLHVMRDGELVEDYPLNSSLVVQAGTTEMQQRYIPLAGWETGEYSFALTLEAVDSATGQVTVLATHELEKTITVP